jgi:hypothetical protein
MVRIHSPLPVKFIFFVFEKLTKKLRKNLLFRQIKNKILLANLAFFIEREEE